MRGLRARGVDNWFGGGQDTGKDREGQGCKAGWGDSGDSDAELMMEAQPESDSARRLGAPDVQLCQAGSEVEATCNGGGPLRGEVTPPAPA